MVGRWVVGGACVVGLLTAVPAAGCGAKTDLDRPDAPGPDVPSPRPESCDGLDNDLDGVIDNGFRDFATGAYNVLEHCGACGFSCPERVEHAVSTACENVRDIVWACRALECEPGYAPTSDRSHCVPWEPLLCRNCADDGDCDVDGGACVDLGGELRCAVSCGPGSPGERACPTGYACTDGLCVPAGGSCSCDPGEFFTVSCDLPTPDGETCLGRAECRDGVLSDCTGREDICDGIDNDCDGTVDQDFVDVRGVYSVDPRNCGECGIDCTVTSLPGMTLTCGGDPYAPRCRILCRDELDGVQVGDLLDADLDIANGCECTVTEIDDVAGPYGAFGPDLDRNCDGADGVVVRSLYVAPDGADTNPGSPFYPILTIGEAVRRAADSLETERPTPDVFVAAGTYVEVVDLPDGVRLHGGYRNDYLGLVPEAFITAVVADDATTAPGGAALVLDGVGVRPSEVGGIQFRGADAPAGGLPAFGAWVRAPGPDLLLTHLWIRAGQGGAGRHGTNGVAGVPPSVAPAEGDVQRPAEEDGRHQCTRVDANVVRGGAGGANTCRGTEVSGGVGGSADCPDPYGTEAPGASGRSGGAGVPGGMGGTGAYDSHGPGTVGCDTPGLCCGVFEVLPEYELAGDGGNGGNGTAGTAGTGCRDPLGELTGETWAAATSTAGTAGGPGGGGGGGGAGGGPQMDWYEEECPWPDALGAGGGGGGAGGCGGEPGTQGESGAPSVGVVIDFGSATGSAFVPRFESVQVVAGTGGNGGRGGGGGDGGLGGLGASGGSRSREELEDSLAAATPGGAGGKGGNGGPAGGAGGGCGGSSVGVWALLRGAADPGVAAAVRTGSVLVSGRGGSGGSGGAGAVPGGNGANGEERDVIVE